MTHLMFHQVNQEALLNDMCDKRACDDLVLPPNYRSRLRKKSLSGSGAVVRTSGGSAEEETEPSPNPLELSTRITHLPGAFACPLVW